MKKINNLFWIIILSPVYIVSYLMLIVWNIPKYFKIITIKNMEHRTKDIDPIDFGN